MFSAQAFPDFKWIFKVLGCLSILGVWKLIEMVIWLINNVEIGLK